MLQSLLFRIYIPGIIGVECDISYKSIFWFFLFSIENMRNIPYKPETRS